MAARHSAIVRCVAMAISMTAKIAMTATRSTRMRAQTVVLPPVVVMGLRVVILPKGRKALKTATTGTTSTTMPVETSVLRLPAATAFFGPISRWVKWATKPATMGTRLRMMPVQRVVSRPVAAMELPAQTGCPMMTATRIAMMPMRWMSMVAVTPAFWLAAVMVWQTGSRAAFVAAVVSVALLWIQQGVGFGSVCKRGLLLLGLGAAAVAAKQLLRPSSTGIPGIDLSSDTGRLAIAQCYSAIPFSGNNRFVYGIGFSRAGEFCSDPIHGGVADHAHNIYLQLFASTGVFGLVGLVLLLVLLVQAWHSAAAEMDPFPRAAGQMTLIYTLTQGVLDLSVLHWPITLILTGLMIGIPLSTGRLGMVDFRTNINP